jgi:hypothetical protein
VERLGYNISTVTHDDGGGGGGHKCLSQEHFYATYPILLPFFCVQGTFNFGYHSCIHVEASLISIDFLMVLRVSKDF